MLVISSHSTTLPRFDNGGTSRIHVSQSLKCSSLCSWDSDSQGKLFIGLIFNVMLFGINVAQTYFYHLYWKKCVFLPRYSSNSLQCPFCAFISIVDQNFGGLMAFWTCLLLGLWACLLSTGRYYLCSRLRSTDILIYISLLDSNRTFRYAMLLLW